MTQRDPHPDNEFIDSLAEDGAPSQSSSSGGRIATDVGSRDELKSATGADDEPTQVHKGDRPDGGASAHPRDGTALGGSQED
ncbi:hypothetical protein HMF7854_13175 [Sphingomonas ginkgonis]|uniref:Uncharacterized protein n=1 Tax=Sphingomonas ginkgonis TaxID=2315330 RepID=A0A3S0ENM0_9SPHN|nr:hypothetical protein [Sphingomonas ginkgonis]RST31680.1 hypothetical protein HMF7854_13175 [Sphingomonas ginkgonis]